MFKNLFGSDTPSPLLQAAYDDVTRMLQQSAKMLGLASRRLLDNEEIDVDLDQLDDDVDEGERMVRRTVLQHLAVQPDQDLVASLVLVSIVQDAERIGDFARGLSELAPLARSRREGPFRDRLARAVERLKPLFATTAEAYRADDVAGAKAVIAEAVALKREMIELVADIAASDLGADMAVVYSDAARILRRIGAHLSNICSTVSQPYDRIRHGDESA
ncbi:MAG TPA: PhoU domain-containing protein [Thermoanaerobaculia bacterium]|nr:PhoU domain-containing protein [Thermoanaerobaculia bacterium]